MSKHCSEGSQPENLQPLLLKTADACRLLGGIHPRSLARAEKSGLIQSIPLLRHKLYAYEDVKKLVEGLREWKP